MKDDECALSDQTFSMVCLVVTSELGLFPSSLDAYNSHLTRRLRPTIAMAATDGYLRCSDPTCNVLGP